MTNRYRQPRAWFATRKDAHAAATAINDRFGGLFASYRRMDERLWEVEAKGIDVKKFSKALAAAGCVGQMSIFNLEHEDPCALGHE